MLLVAKKNGAIVILTLILIINNCSASDIKESMSFLVIGQSISSNCNEHKFPPIPNVNQFDLSGRQIPAQDPLIWADCKGGSLWIPFGHKLIEEKIAKTINLFPIGVAGTKIEDWLPQGKANQKLDTALTLIRRKNIHIDYILFYQGSSNIGTPATKYQTQLSQLSRNVRDIIGYHEWIIATHSKCFGKYDPNIATVQQSFNNAPFYAGPNSNQLGDVFRVDKCHLNQQGQIKMADMWADAVKSAINKKRQVEHETLISLFRQLPF